VLFIVISFYRIENFKNNFTFCVYPYLRLHFLHLGLGLGLEAMALALTPLVLLKSLEISQSEQKSSIFDGCCKMRHFCPCQATTATQRRQRY